MSPPTAKPLPVPVTTDSRRRLHYARQADLKPGPSTNPADGLRGQTLCGNNGFDQQRYDAVRRKRPWWKPLDISTLPLCRRCGKAVGEIADKPPLNQPALLDLTDGNHQ